MARLRTKQYEVEDRGRIETPNGFGFDLWLKIEIEGECDCGYTFDKVIEAPLRAKNIHLKCAMCMINVWTLNVKIV